MNVQGAWAQGVTGRGVVVTILDDGLEKDHPDLMDNYVSTGRPPTAAAGALGYPCFYSGPCACAEVWQGRAGCWQGKAG